MDWDQIESKWAAMARRVRGSGAADDVDAMGATPRLLTTEEGMASQGAEYPSVENTDQTDTMLAQ